MKLAAKLEIWEGKNFISPQQKEQILAFENQNSGNRWVLSLVYFAAFLVGLGLISLVAANWQEIPDALKLCGAVVLMCLNAAVIFTAKQSGRNLMTQIFTIIFAFLLMAVIGLTGQVYHLRSDIGGACLFWGVISFPLMFLMPRLVWLWLPVVFFGAEWKAIDFPFWSMEEKLKYFPTIRLFVLVVFYEILVGFQKLRDGAVVSALRVYSGLSLLLLYFFSFSWLFSSVSGGYYVAMTAFVLILNVVRKRVSFMPLFLLLGAMPFLMPVNVITGVLFCTILCGYSYYHKLPKLFNASVLLMVLRVLGFYMDTSNLLSAGLGMIVSGVVLLSVILGLRKYGRKLWEKK